MCCCANVPGTSYDCQAEREAKSQQAAKPLIKLKSAKGDQAHLLVSFGRPTRMVRLRCKAFVMSENGSEGPARDLRS